MVPCVDYPKDLAAQIAVDTIRSTPATVEIGGPCLLHP